MIENLEKLKPDAILVEYHGWLGSIRHQKDLSG